METTLAMPVSGSAAISRIETLSDNLMALIEQVVWGFDTGVRYRILERRAEFEHVLSLGYFLILSKNSQLVGTLLCLNKKISLGFGGAVNALYETTLTVVPSEHGRGYAKRLVQEAGTNADRRSLEYAYIEEKNLPSAAAFKAQGFQTLGQFHATTFNRLRPKLAEGVRRLPSGQADEMKALLSELYRDHAFTDFDVSLRPENYWIVMENGRIVAGAQVEEELWSIESMPGPDGWFAVKVLPHLPILNQILNPKRIPVIKIGNLYVPEGREKDFMELVEHLTHHYQKKLALAYLDKKSPITMRLKSKLNFGLFNLFFETPVNIWARLHGTDQNEIENLKGRPFHISPLDIS
jgi:hypothetical protein